nr:type I methionyl aminopeptidase [Anaerolineae bacterium]
MVIQSDKELQALKRIGQIVAITLAEMREQVKPGITTGELDAIGARILAQHGSVSAPIAVYDFPGATCISLNNEAAHGIPGSRVIEPGDLVNIDVSAALDGYFADTAASIPVPPVSDLKQRLCDCALEAQQNAFAVARAGNKLSDIGRAVEMTATRCGFSVIRELPGHAIGRTLHEKPTVLNFYHPTSDRYVLPKGLVITIEPFLTTGARHIKEAKDGWTLLTTDNSLAAQYEHTIVITEGKPLILTACE